MFLLALLGFDAAHAQSADAALPPLNSQLFRPTLDGKRTLWTDDAKSGEDRQAFWRFLGHYTDAPLVYEFARDGSRIDLVSSVLQGNLMAGYSFGRLRMGVDLPIYFVASSHLGNDGGGLGNLAADAKLTLLEGDDVPVELALQGRLSLPTGSVDLPLSEPKTAWEIAVIGDKDIGNLLLAANFGLYGGSKAELENITVDDSFVFRTAAAYAFTEDQGFAGEFTGRTYLSKSEGSAGLPLEFLASGYSYIGGDLVVRGGAGAGLTEGIGSPNYRVILGLGYEPRAKPKTDRDMDGIFDHLDACPDEPEDIDGDEDADGCPDGAKDSDGDGILDDVDKCPNEAEDFDTYKDEDGCIDPLTEVTISVVDEDGPVKMARVNVIKVFKKVKVGAEHTRKMKPGEYDVVIGTASHNGLETKIVVVEGAPQTIELKLDKHNNSKITVHHDHIELKEKVYFSTGKSTIKKESFDLLDQVAQVMTDYTEIKKLRIVGHTDSRGNDANNLKLSKSRAAAVLTYLQNKGVEEARLESDGMGETKPLDPAATEEAYAKNRRVEITIAEWDAGEDE